MPYSLDMGKDIIKNWFNNQKDIHIITDLGPGIGSYPKLLGKERYTWKAVEIWAPYIEKYRLGDIYSEIRVGDIRYMELPEADCVIIGDVLEHVSKEDAIRTFKKIDAQFKHVVLSIPMVPESERCVDGNKFESHRSSWEWEELNELVPDTFKIRKKISPIAIFIK